VTRPAPLAPGRVHRAPDTARPRSLHPLHRSGMRRRGGANASAKGRRHHV